jgi:hypothetical protein
MRAVISRVAVLALLAACGDPAARVQLVPVDLGDCGKPSRADVTSMIVTAYTASGEQPRGIALDATGTISIGDFPADTLQLGVELHGQTGVIAAGKTAPLDFAALPDRTQIPIAIVPMNGFCRVGALVQARNSPLVARAGGGVLVAGGSGAAGQQLASAEYYDPVTASFAPVALPSDLLDNVGSNGLAGGVLTSLPDGTVALSGTAAHALAIFDAATLSFDAPKLLDARAFHGALAIAADRLFVIGGCSDIAACGGSPVDSSFTFHLPDAAVRDGGPALPDGALRVGATVFDLGIGSDGLQRYALAGGTGDPGAVDRFALAGGSIATLGGLAAQVVALDGGALLSAFAPDGMPASSAASQLPPEGNATVPVAKAPLLTGARLVAVEDGSVLAIGGDATGDVARYVPTVNAWTSITPPAMAMKPATGEAPALVAPALLRMPDGTVLAIEGGSAWLFRPSLIGASSGLVEVDVETGAPGVLIPFDPSTATHAGTTLTLSGPALVGGFRANTGAVNAALQITGGHVQLIAQQLGPGRALIGDLPSEGRARVLRLDGGTSRVLCTGQTVPDFDPTATTPVGLEIRGHSAVLSVAHAPLATCDLSNDPDAGDSGAWGISALDSTQLQVVTVTVQR